MTEGLTDHHVSAAIGVGHGNQWHRASSYALRHGARGVSQRFPHGDGCVIRCACSGGPRQKMIRSQMAREAGSGGFLVPGAMVIRKGTNVREMSTGSVRPWTGVDRTAIPMAAINDTRPTSGSDGTATGPITHRDSARRWTQSQARTAT
jgi:hypothetical protein